jgi:hypothetical protein
MVRKKKIGDFVNGFLNTEVVSTESIYGDINLKTNLVNYLLNYI